MAHASGPTPMAEVVETAADRAAKAVAEKVERNRTMGWPDLDPVVRALCMHYVSNGYDFGKAARSCRLTPAKARELLRDPVALAFIEDQQKLRGSAGFVTRDFIQSNYLRLIELGMGEEDVSIVDQKGRCFKAKKFMPELVLGCLRELQKLTPEFNKAPAGGPIGEEAKPPSLSNDEFKNIAKEMASKI